MTHAHTVRGHKVEFVYDSRRGEHVIHVDGVRVWGDGGGANWPDTGNPSAAQVELAEIIVRAHVALKKAGK